MTLNRKKILLELVSFALGVAVAGFVCVSFLLMQFNNDLPSTQSIKSIELKIPLRVYSADKLLIAEFGNERRNPIEIENTPQYLIDAIVAIEDNNFFHHKGVDLKGLLRAFVSNFSSGQTQQGGSTITMQVARNFFLSRDKTYARKIKEVLLSAKLEQVLTKNEILSLYLNKIFLGHRAYGFGAAAHVYYGKKLAELSLAENAMLAGLPKAPSANNPLRNPDRALTRRNYILKRMLELKKISQSEHEQAQALPLTAKKHLRNVELSAPHIAEMVRNEIIQRLGEQAYWEGINVYTTIDSKKQIAAEHALRKGLKSYDKRHGFRGKIGHHTLAQSNEDNAALISQYPSSKEQIPVLVLSVTANQAEAIDKENQPIIIKLKHSKWARKFNTVSSRGDVPRSMKQLLKTGDVVYVEPVVNKSTKQPNKETEQANHEWQLSQIPNLSGALVEMEPRSGKIKALVGGYDFFLNKYNRAIQSVRQPGSNIKPFIYSASLAKGFTPASLISGAPIIEKDATHGTIWKPMNYSGKFYGPTRMRTALSKSMNLVSIRLLRSIGIPYAREYVSRFGIDVTRFAPSLTMALGSGGIEPINMLNAYSTLANGGYRLKPVYIDNITDRHGEVIFKSKRPVLCDKCYTQLLEKLAKEEQGQLNNLKQGSIDEVAEIEPIEEVELDADMQAASLLVEESTDNTEPLTYTAPRVMSKANNFLTVSMMKDVVRNGTARKALQLNRDDLAGKTGTTNDYIDAWFSGFNSKVAATVWVGFDTPSTMGRGGTGSGAALPIWIDYMKTSLKGVAEDSKSMPSYIEARFIDKTTGKASVEQSENSMKEYFAIDAQAPRNYSLNNGTDSFIDKSNGEFRPAVTGGSGGSMSPQQQQTQPKIIEQGDETEGLF